MAAVEAPDSARFVGGAVVGGDLGAVERPDSAVIYGLIQAPNTLAAIEAPDIAHFTAGFRAVGIVGKLGKVPELVGDLEPPGKLTGRELAPVELVAAQKAPPGIVGRKPRTIQLTGKL
jgi:hypothetical protein